MASGLPTEKFITATEVRGGDHYGLRRSNPNANFKKGNRAAAAELMSPESHQRRMNGLYKTWALRQKMKYGHKPKELPIRQKTKYHKLRRTQVALEHAEVQETARRAAPAAMERLTQIVEDPKTQPSFAIAAATVILDRAYGKASQTNINATVDTNAKPSELPEKDLNERIANALRKVEALTGGKAKAQPRQKRPPDLRKPDRDPDSTTRH